MYIVTIKNGVITTEIHGDIEKLTSGKIVKGISTIDSFTFTILPSNKGFGLLNEYTTLVDVFNTNTKKYVFQGRVLMVTPSMDTNGKISKDVVCESLLGYLRDGSQHEHKEKTESMYKLVPYIVDWHNLSVEEEKQVHIGKDDIVKECYTLAQTGIDDGTSTWDALNKLICEELGGIISYRCEDGKIYLDFLKDKSELGEVKTTEIALSKNMKAITRKRDATEIITRVIPRHTGKVSTIAASFLPELYVDDAEGIKQYGVHSRVIAYEGYFNHDALRQLSKNWLKNQKSIAVNYIITALDLFLIGLDIDEFEVGNSHPIKNALMGIDDTAQIVKKTIDVCEEIKSTIEIGESFKTFSETQREKLSEVAAAEKILNGINGDYVSSGTVVAAINSATDVVNLSGNRLAVTSDNFSLSEKGVAKMKSGAIGALSVSPSGISAETNTSVSRAAGSTTEKISVEAKAVKSSVQTHDGAGAVIASAATELSKGTLNFAATGGGTKQLLMTATIDGALHNIYIDTSSLSFVIEKA